MNHPIVQSSEGVTLVAGGPVTRRDLTLALARAPMLVAADGGGDRALALGHRPDAVIGDMDSLSSAGRAELGGRVHHLPDQDSTDFDKCLRSIEAPFVLAVGVAGARIDHGLAVMNVLVRRSDRLCLLIGPQDVLFVAPRDMRLMMTVGDRLSLFPLGRVSGESTGLRWPIGGLKFAPDGVIGTSNEVSEPEVRLSFDAASMLVMVPRRRLDAVLSAVLPEWRGRAQPPVRAR